MKHIKILTLLVTIVLFFRCNEQDLTDVFSIKDFSSSDCKISKNEAVENETISLKTINKDELKIIHSNAVFACCPNGELKVEASVANDTIVVNEYFTDNSCNCLCPYDIEYTIGKLEYDEYTIVLQKMNSDYSTFSINFNSDTDTIITIN